MIELQDITSIFLDLDGTLLDLNFDNHFWQELVPERFAQLKGLAPVVARRQLLPWFRGSEGQLEWYCLDYWSTLLDLDLVALKAELSESIVALPHVTEFLHYLRAFPLRVVLVTNAHPQSLGLKLRKSGLSAYLDRVVISHDLGLPKEDPRFWDHLMAIEPFEPASSLMIDDNLAVLRSARRFGIGHVLAIDRNDSGRPPRTITEFPAIHDFRELMQASAGPPG